MWYYSRALSQPPDSQFSDFFSWRRLSSPASQAVENMQEAFLIAAETWAQLWGLLGWALEMPHPKAGSRGCANQPMAVRTVLSLYACLCTWLRKESHPECRSDIKSPNQRASHFIPFSVLLSLGVSHDVIKMPPSKDFSLNCMQSRTCSITAELILAWTSNSEEAKLLVLLHMDNTSLIPSGFAFSFSKPPKHSVCGLKCFFPLLLENCWSLKCETAVFIVI